MTLPGMEQYVPAAKPKAVRRTPKAPIQVPIKFSEMIIAESYTDDGDGPVYWGLFREQADVEVVARVTIDGEPTSKARARFTSKGSKTRAYTPENVRQAEEVIGWKFRQACPAGWVASPDGAFGVIAIFFAATYQRRDVDNMLKLILDGLNGVAWKDDSQVTEVSGRLRRGENDPRTEVVVYRTLPHLVPTTTCEQCGQSFRTHKSWAKRRFCARSCEAAWRRARRTRTCPNCGVEFLCHKPGAPQIHCSRQCHDEASRLTVTCAECGTNFTKPRSMVRAGNSYCNKVCEATYWRKRKAANAKGTCEACGGPTSKRSYRRCNACRIGGGKP